MTSKSHCREKECICVDCFQVNDITPDPCQKYCETICRGTGEPLFKGDDHHKCSHYKNWSNSAK